ncbi:MAG: sortase, partial [Clostridia bacterium]|nr:sortase [Clostridia bacterium]
CWGKMTIPSIGLTAAPMYNGDDTKILSYTHSKAIGKRYGSQFPGQGGRTILCSHVTRAFYGLQDMEKGDRIILNTFY